MAFEWNGPRVEAQLRARLLTGVIEASEAAVEALREAVSEPYPPASEPGAPPHLRTGRLRAEISYEVSEANLTSTIHADSPEALFTEKGTSGPHGMAARPWFAVTLARNASRLGRIMAGVERHSGGSGPAASGGFFSRLGRALGGAIAKVRNRR